MLESLVTFWNVLLVLIGFGFVIFWHELGHFITARWAKIRVLEFAVGFGPAICSYRKGLGLRRGSTNPEYDELLKKHRLEVAEELKPGDVEKGNADLDTLPGVSQTEYRLNWIPLGGYVRMLGQEDANPSATSSAPDSYSQVPVWKRMIVVSGGVIMNVILAAALFIGVYSVGLESPAPAISVDEQSPAYRAGMRTGDIVRSVNGEAVEVFQDLLLQVGLSKKGEPLSIEVDRQGEGLLGFEVEPEYNEDVQIRAIGAYSLPSATLKSPRDPASLENFDELAARHGLAGIDPGMRLVSVSGLPVESSSVAPWGEVSLPTALLEAAKNSGGQPFAVTFARASDGDTKPVQTEEFAFVPQPRFDVLSLGTAEHEIRVPHLLGLTPPMMVASTQRGGKKSGLERGDLFVRIGDVAWPSMADGIRLIRENADGELGATVLRDGERVELKLRVDGEGRVGFGPMPAMDTPYLVGTPSGAHTGEEPDWRRTDQIAGEFEPGARLVRVGGTPVASLSEAASALASSTRDARDAGVGSRVDLTISQDDAERTLTWTLSAEDIEHLHEQWTGEIALQLFEPAMITQIGKNPMHSIGLGLRETKRMLTRVYLTLGRLADGSVKPQQLKGPVGITHIGSRVAREGPIRLLFFIGLISANLAVLNFLPLPIVDGGLFLMLCYEGITKKPVPVAVQNALTIIGLVGIVAVFLYVTTNDVLNLFG